MGIGWYLVPVEFVHFDSNPQYQHPQCQSKTQLVPGWVNQTFFVRKKKQFQLATSYRITTTLCVKRY